MEKTGKLKLSGTVKDLPGGAVRGEPERTLAGAGRFSPGAGGNYPRVRLSMVMGETTSTSSTCRWGRPFNAHTTIASLGVTTAAGTAGCEGGKVEREQESGGPPRWVRTSPIPEPPAFDEQRGRRPHPSEGEVHPRLKNQTVGLPRGMPWNGGKVMCIVHTVRLRLTTGAPPGKLPALTPSYRTCGASEHLSELFGDPPMVGILPTPR